MAAFLKDLTKHMSTQQNGDMISEEIAFSLLDTGKDNSNGMLTQAGKTHMHPPKALGKHPGSQPSQMDRMPISKDWQLTIDIG